MGRPRKTQHVNALRAARLRTGLEPQQMAHEMQVSVRTLREQENQRVPKLVYVLAAEQVAWRREHQDLHAVKARDDQMRRLFQSISDAAAKGLGL